MTMKKSKIPKFKSIAEEAAFWAKLDLSEYFEPSDFNRESSNLESVPI